MNDLKIVNAAISNDIYLSKVLKDGTMSDKRKVVTSEVLAAALTHILTMQQHEKGFGIGYGTVHGDKILTVIPESKLAAVKIAARELTPITPAGDSGTELMRDLYQAYDVVANQDKAMKENEKERIELDNFIDYLVGRMDGDRIELEAEFKRLEEIE